MEEKEDILSKCPMCGEPTYYTDVEEGQLRHCPKHGILSAPTEWLRNTRTISEMAPLRRKRRMRESVKYECRCVIEYELENGLMSVVKISPCKKHQPTQVYWAKGQK